MAADGKRAPITGAATPEGTRRYAAKHVDRLQTDHFAGHAGLQLSSVGLGTYLGDPDSRTDQGYVKSITKALGMGCNVIDSAINYRMQRSERCIGEALRHAIQEGTVSRDEVVLATKGGYIPLDPEFRGDYRGWIQQNIIGPGIAAREEIVDGSHCMTPRYLRLMLDTSRKNLGVETIDVYYVHNPEGQLDEVLMDEFLERTKAAFVFLEDAVKLGHISRYGFATWNGFRIPPTQPGYLPLEDIMQVAKEAGGEHHHFGNIQLPYNLGMPDAALRKNQQIGKDVLCPLEAMERFGLTVMTSASMLQGKLSRNLPKQLILALPEAGTDAQRAIQFVRSTPGVATALVGMKTPAHVEENLAIAKVPRSSRESIESLFAPA